MTRIHCAGTCTAVTQPSSGLKCNEKDSSPGWRTSIDAVPINGRRSSAKIAFFCQDVESSCLSAGVSSGCCSDILISGADGVRHAWPVLACTVLRADTTAHPSVRLSVRPSDRAANSDAMKIYVSSPVAPVFDALLRVCSYVQLASPCAERSRKVTFQQPQISPSSPPGKSGEREKRNAEDLANVGCCL